jgi:transcriptional regulator with XRE-family HTH domain
VIETMADPNAALRSVRHALRMSQEELARAVRAAGDRAGEPNGASKRLIQRWESGEVASPQGAYARALELATGVPLENLGFTPADERYGVDRDEAMSTGGAAWIPVPGPLAAQGALTGIWKSTYRYVSSGRADKEFSSTHMCVILQHGNRLQLRSLPESAPSRLMMDLTANGQVVTGTWTERTDLAGYYEGSVYSGGIQLLLDPTGHRMAGRWLGYGRDFDINDGPWTLERVTSDTSAESIAEHDRPAEDAEAQ